jgi:hypothetical protein
MAKLIYSAVASFDGYVEDENGRFEWAAPDEEVHQFVNELERPVGTYLYGRRMYQTMAFWETDAPLAEASPAMREYAEIWRAADKIVYSRTLASVSTARTRLERAFAPEAVLELKGLPPQRRLCRRGGSRCAGDRAWARRRAPALAGARCGGGRQAGPPGRRAPRPRASRRAPVRQRRDLPPVPRFVCTLTGKVTRRI